MRDGDFMRAKKTAEPVREADAIDAANEDIPAKPLPTTSLPTPNKGELQHHEPHEKKDGMDKAMDILDEYYDQTPTRDFEHTDDW
jgi:hypothetical protein